MAIDPIHIKLALAATIDRAVSLLLPDIILLFFTAANTLAN
jgi:hypothetical protein